MLQNKPFMQSNCAYRLWEFVCAIMVVKFEKIMLTNRKIKTLKTGGFGVGHKDQYVTYVSKFPSKALTKVN